MLTPLRPILQSAYNFWFKGLDPTSYVPPESVVKRWWGIDTTKEQGEAFDQQCSHLFLKPLQEILRMPHQSIVERQQSALQLLKECSQNEYKDSLGLMILIDQMPRNIYRGDSANVVYSHFDPLTQIIAQNMLSRKVDTLKHADQITYRLWFYLPLMHSEDVKQHETVAHFMSELEDSNKSNPEALQYQGISQQSAKKHLGIIEKFGRYPHRNACMKRLSTPEEAKWLAEGNTYH